MRIVLTIFLLSSQFFLTLAQINFQAQSDFSYLRGSNAADLQTDWMFPDFDDSQWLSGTAPFWYGDGDGGVNLTDMQNNYSTVYFRSSFQCKNSDLLDKILFNINFDDGFILWINGVEVLNVNAPASPLFNSLATGSHESGSFEQYEVISSDINLSEGINYIAVQGFNIGLASTDFHFDVQIDARLSLPEYPDTLSIVFSEPSGYYDSNFICSVSTPDDSSSIVYTLDGSNPQNSITSFTQDSVAHITIDPGSSLGRATTPAVILRASVMRDGYNPSIPKSRTFIFLEEVKTQSHPGGSWPTGSINSQSIDLEVDPTIISHPDYSPLIDDAFYEIPSISIITDINNLFSPATGIYVNARQDGAAWERECSLELLNPDGSDGFGVNAGLRIRGGFSRAPEFAKHSFRLLFKKEYGDAKLYFPLFGNEGVSRFDNLDLRTAQNYAWSNGDSRNTMVKEVFSRDSQRDMGQPYTRSRYYHLYLNGMYWGLYQSQERSESDYAADYFDGKSEDYDVVKVEALLYDITATDGTTTSWREVYNRSYFGFEDNESYFELEGKDENGNHIQGATSWIEIDNLIDYMLITFYAGNLDGPVSEPLRNKQPNNFYAIYNREDKSEGFKFFAHDAEHSLLGLNDNRVNLEDRTDGNEMVVNVFKEFHPQWLHYKLTWNQEYKQRFSDRAYAHLSKGGALSPESALNRFNRRVSQIDTAIIAESARWGDGRRFSEPFTRNDNWSPEIEKMQNEYFPQRTSVVISQLKSAGLFSSLNAPLVNLNNIPIDDSFYKFEASVSISLSNPDKLGNIYYTTKGKDPREIGGEISENAIFCDKENTSVLIQSTSVVNARIYYEGNWGPLKQIIFLKTNEDYSSLKVTELHYHPLDVLIGLDTVKGKDLEFIELKNIGEDALNLSGLILDSAVYYKFPDNEILLGGQFYVISSKTAKFYEHYGLNTSGNYSGNFSNAGEEVLLQDSDGNEIIHFTYEDEVPWPVMADGPGYSLVSADRNPITNPDQPSYWNHSQNIDGSPFKDEPHPANDQCIRSGNTSVAIYPNPTSDILNILVDSNTGANETVVEMYSIRGVLLYHSVHPLRSTLSLNSLNLEHGIYIVTLRCEDFIGSYRIVY